ncbi:MAG: sulfatase-like hydrolase/transferase, partial [Planctomycetes bacterium]|nr:sulfatase-like hydrolase/transferase [Planctomycetota bacterium]
MRSAKRRSPATPSNLLPQLLHTIATLILTTAAATLSSNHGKSTLGAENCRVPNIVLILADDMGYSDIGCYGGEVETPNLNRLAAGGLRFTQFYNTGRCCPTRASLLTGLYPHQAGVGHMMSDWGRPGYRGDLNEQCATIAEVLGDAGYQTMMAGKWHVTRHVGHWSGDKQVTSKHNWPRQRGFEKFYGIIHGAASFYDPISLARDNEPVEPEGDAYYFTDAISDNAVQYIDEASREKPFFLYVAYTAPHWPLHAPAEVVAKYKERYRKGWDAIRHQRRKRMIEQGLVREEWELTPRDSAVPAWEDAPHHDWEAHRMAVYAAMIDIMDQGIGRILDALERAGRSQNTLIFFLADNGGCAEVIGPRWGGLHIPKETRDGRPLFEAGYGMADREAEEANTPDTLFCIGSMGKMFTGVAVAQLVEDGRLSFEDPIGKHLTGFPSEIATGVTVHHLLTHSAGMGDIFRDEPITEENHTIAALMEHVVAEPLQF